MVGERTTPTETATPQQVYAKGQEILKEFGFPGIQESYNFVPRPGSNPALKRGEDIPTAQAPIVPLEISGREYRIWLQQNQDGDDRPIRLSIHFQQSLDFIESVEFDDEGYVSGYRVKYPGNNAQFVTAIRPRPLPKSISEFWYVAHTYEILEDLVENDNSRNVAPEIGQPVKGDEAFVLNLLEQMQSILKDPDFAPPPAVELPAQAANS